MNRLICFAVLLLGIAGLALTERVRGEEITDYTVDMVVAMEWAITDQTQNCDGIERLRLKGAYYAVFVDSCGPVISIDRQWRVITYRSIDPMLLPKLEQELEHEMPDVSHLGNRAK